MTRGLARLPIVALATAKSSFSTKPYCIVLWERTCYDMNGYFWRSVENNEICLCIVKWTHFTIHVKWITCVCSSCRYWNNNMWIWIVTKSPGTLLGNHWSNAPQQQQQQQQWSLYELQTWRRPISASEAERPAAQLWSWSSPLYSSSLP